MKILTQINLQPFVAFSFSCFKSLRFLLIKKEPAFTHYLLVPSDVKKICVRSNELLFLGLNTKIQSCFLNSLIIIKNSCRLKKKKLIFKGLGFKIQYSTNDKTLIFKLGYSHLIFLKVLSGVEIIKIGKNYLIIAGFDLSALGNFLTTIQSLRFPDSYKGKGFWKKYEKPKLKIFKKK